MKAHQHFCPYCRKMYSCKGLDCIDEAGDEYPCELCQFDLREVPDENDHLSEV